MVNNDLLSRVALRTGDQQFKDFDKSIYLDALKKANREIARKYGIPNKVVSFTLSDMISDVEDTVILDIADMKDEYTVKVNDRVLSKNSLERMTIDYNCYFLQMLDNAYQFDYRYFVDLENPFVKDLTDEIEIFYTALPDYDADMSDYFIPHKYVEEQVDLTAMTIAEYALAKFEDEIKIGKYTRLLQMLRKGSDYNKFQVEDRPWAVIKPWSPI